MKNKLLSKLSDNPILSIATAIITLIATANSITGSIGLPPFWSDLLVSIILLSITIYWSFDSWKESSNKAKSHILSNVKYNISIQQRIRNIGIYLIILPILIILILYNIYPTTLHLINYKWTLCGQFIVKNPNESCLILYDARNRKISDKCYKLDDDSGYKHLNIPNWWIYKPQTAAVKYQQNISEKKKLKSEMFDCSGFIKLQ